MKLHQFATLKETAPKHIMEASGHALEPVLNNIIKDKKSGADLNVYEVFVLGNLAWFFASGYTATNGQLDGIVNIESTATSTESVEQIRALSADDVDKLVCEFLWLIKVGNSPTSVTASSVAGMNAKQWIEYVLRKQD